MLRRIFKWAFRVLAVMIVIVVGLFAYVTRWEFRSGLADYRLASLVAERMDSLPPEEAIPLRNDYLAWRSKLQAECTQVGGRLDIDADNRRLACQERLHLARLRFLQTPRDTLIFTGVDADRSVCQQLLSAERLVWRGRGVAEEEYFQARQLFADRFDYLAPEGLESLVESKTIAATNLYRVDKVWLDLTGSGTPQEVYRVGALTEATYVSNSITRGYTPAPTRTGALWFVLPIAGEEAAIEDAFRVTLQGGHLTQFENLAVLATRFRGGTDDLAEFLSAYDPAREASQPAVPQFKSKRVAIPPVPEVSAEMRLTPRMLFRMGGTSYILADNGHGALMLFRPRPGRSPQSVCRWTAASSTIELVVTRLSEVLPCPYQDGSAMRDVQWPAAYPARTVLDLPEWGGPRPLVQVQSAHGYIFPHVFVGALGAGGVEPPTRREDRPVDHWAPTFQTFDHDEVLIRKGGDVHYIVGRDYPQPRDRRLEPLTTYYRVTDNSLVPVCRVESRVVPPERYRSRPGPSTPSINHTVVIH